MGLKNFQIIFDNPWNTYYCGQQVTGRVLLTVDAPKKIRGIIIQFKGEAAVKFDETTQTRDKDGNNVNETTNYTSSEIYFENKFNLVGGASGESTLPSGEHCYPFQTILPQILPSSLEGEFGHVRYTVKVTIDRPWKFDQEAKAAFTVISPLDLNLHPTAKDPVKITREKYFCCCCCKSGPLTLVVLLPASGYVPGQEIPVTVEVDNISQQEVSNVTCKLRKLVSFHAFLPHKSTKSDKITLGELSFGSVGKNGSATWTQMFQVPPLPPSNLTNCSLIDLDYELKIEGKVSGYCHHNIDVKIPIFLGTIPLVGLGNIPVAGPVAMGPVVASDKGGSGPQGPGAGSPLYPQQPQNAGVLPPQGPPTAGFQYPGYPQSNNSGLAEPQANLLYPSLPPPSYGECMSGGKNIQDAGDNKYLQGNLDFTPRYPVYNFEKPSAPIQ